MQIKQILSIIQEKEAAKTSNPAANVADAASGLLKTFSRLRRLIIDSGATDHINSSPQLLINSKNIIMPPVSMPSGEQAPITSVGDLPLNSTFTLKMCLVSHPSKWIYYLSAELLQILIIR